MLITIYSSHRMSLPRSIALLLLCTIVTLANAQSCPVISDTTITSNNYTLTTPSSVTNGITYQVTCASTNTTNGIVLLQVLLNNTSVGNWSSSQSGSANCTGGITYSFVSGNFSFTASWTAPSSLNSPVIFKALFNDTNGVYAPSQNATFATATTATTATTNTTASSGGPANHLAPMFFTLMEALFFLVVTSKFLF